ncbi:MAG: hypothetical protein KF774_10655 [Planctomyces sp.]|nr:hypothetical protein [Planctomyces sp.]
MYDQAALGRLAQSLRQPTASAHQSQPASGDRYANVRLAMQPYQPGAFRNRFANVYREMGYDPPAGLQGSDYAGPFPTAQYQASNPAVYDSPEVPQQQPLNYRPLGGTPVLGGVADGRGGYSYTPRIGGPDSVLPMTPEQAAHIRPSVQHYLARNAHTDARYQDSRFTSGFDSPGTRLARSLVAQGQAQAPAPLPPAPPRFPTAAIQASLQANPTPTPLSGQAMERYRAGQERNAAVQGQRQDFRLQRMAAMGGPGARLAKSILAGQRQQNQGMQLPKDPTERRAYVANFASGIASSGLNPDAVRKLAEAFSDADLIEAMGAADEQGRRAIGDIIRSRTNVPKPKFRPAPGAVPERYEPRRLPVDQGWLGRFWNELTGL